MATNKKRRGRRKKGNPKREKMMKWMLEFATQDLSKKTAQGWMELSDQVRTFLLDVFDLQYYWEEQPVRGFPDFIEQLDEGLPEELTNRAGLTKLQNQLRKALEELFPEQCPEDGDPIHIGYWPVPAPRPHLLLTSRVAWKRRYAYGPGDKRGKRPTTIKEEGVTGHFQSMYWAEWPTLFWVAVGEALKGIKGTNVQIQRCSVCEEKRLYVKTKRQAYCSVACSQKVRAKTWYAKHKTEYNAKRKKAKEQPAEPNAETALSSGST